MSNFFQFGSSVMQAAAIRQQSEVSARASIYNAEIGKRNAQIQETKTRADVQSARRNARAMQGAARAAAGVTGGLQGSALDILASNAAQQELDVLNIRQQGELQKTAFLEGAQLDTMRARSARTAGRIGSAASILRGTSSFLGNMDG